MHLLIVGDPEDLTAVYVGFQAEQRGASILRLPEDRFGLDWTFALDDLHRERDQLLVHGVPLAVGDVAGAYVRFHHSPAGLALEQIEPQLAEMYLAQRRSALHLLLERLSCPVVNRPTSGTFERVQTFSDALARAGEPEAAAVDCQQQRQ